MSNETLYHFFPRKFIDIDSVMNILESMFENGIFLSKETLNVPWKDHFGKNLNRVLHSEQYRFCLTAITNNEELINHSQKFGCIGIEFDTNFIAKLGGFPVFYVPAPHLESNDTDDYKGISLLYRIADAKELLEYIIENKILVSEDIDIENTLGALRFLGNICYPTQRKTSNSESNYYAQREWRIIYGLTSKKAVIKKYNENYTLSAFDDIPIYNFINKIIVHNFNQSNSNTLIVLQEKIKQLLNRYNHNITVQYLK